MNSISSSIGSTDEDFHSAVFSSSSSENQMSSSGSSSDGSSEEWESRSYPLSLPGKTDIISSSFTQNFAVIQDIYNQFNSLETTQKKSDQEIIASISFEQSVAAMEAMEGQYESLYKINRSQAKHLKSTLDAASKMVQAMNAHSSTLTKQDLRGIQSFFKQSIEEEYHHTNDQGEEEVFVQGDHSKLLHFAGQFFVSGEYESIGLVKHCDKIPGNICDILYLRKKPDQIKFEKEYPQIVQALKAYYFNDGQYISDGEIKEQFRWRVLGSSVREREHCVSIIRQQFQLTNDCVPSLSKQCKKWKYKKFECCDETTLVKYGISDEGSKGLYCIIFFYRKKEQ